MSYLDKYKGQYGRNSVYDILSLNPNIPADWEIIKREYVAVDIDKVVINGNTFTNYGDFQFIWEKSYVKNPERSGNGTIDNLNSYATFVVPRLIMNFSIMSIDDYRQIVKLDLETNEFVVECYDTIYNKRITTKMYIAPLEIPKLHTIARVRFDENEWEEFVELVGVREYSVELIGTKSDLDLVSVRYIVNAPEGATPETDITDIGEEDIYRGEEIIIGGAASAIVAETFGGRYQFKNWNTSASGGSQNVYLNGYAYTINSDLVLYAQWQSNTDHILTYNYGVLSDKAEADPENYPTTKFVTQNAGIGILPATSVLTGEVIVPTVTIDGVDYQPYYNGGWYKTPTRAENSTPITNNALYWTNRNSTIYLLYQAVKYGFSLWVQKYDGTFGVNQVASIEYNSPLNLPSLVKNGYTFDGWYTDNSLTTKYTGTTMPPYSLNLYARWNKND